MTSAEIKKAGIEALRAAGVDIASSANAMDIYAEMRKVGLCDRAVSNEYVRAIGRAVGAFKDEPDLPAFAGHRRAYRPAPHPRLADIQRAQPPMMGMRGIGNGSETTGYGRGK